MSLPRILFQILLLPILALMLPLFYGVAWLREAMGDLALKRAPVVVTSRPLETPAMRRLRR
jgi:hypothetical protein